MEFPLKLETFLGDDYCMGSSMPLSDEARGKLPVAPAMRRVAVTLRHSRQILSLRASSYDGRTCLLWLEGGEKGSCSQQIIRAEVGDDGNHERVQVPDRLPCCMS